MSCWVSILLEGWGSIQLCLRRNMLMTGVGVTHVRWQSLVY